MTSAAENHLGREASPYLLQHQDNPVHWYPWGPEAFEAAAREDKPILLSVGYAACHWCHVMAHESFESDEIAAVMNELFVNIKVDREERPDIDTIYQTALALMGEQGGWPLTMFLTPQREPFWGGTYFPPDARFGRPGFPQVLQAMAKAYAEDKANVAKNVNALKEGLSKLSANQSGELITLEQADQVAQRLTREFDPFQGGVGQAPKFPQPTLLKQIWRAWKRSGAEPFRKAVDLSLNRMCQGGIYDHLGGGFARYAVDTHWLVPHFEKMLYDNAQLLDLLTWLWQDTENPLYERRARETVAWLEREMMAEQSSGGPACGGFASSLDADSEGEEGRFYVWQEAEIDALLGEDAAAFKQAYGVTPHGNWEGKTILNRSHDEGLAAPDEEARLEAMRTKLLEARAGRVRPGWDDKVLADWNGLMIAALARSAEAFGEPGWLAMAERTFAFVCEEMTVEGRLRHAWRHGEARHPATLEDYANLADAALALHEVTGKSGYLSQATAWIEVLDQHYWDDESGGYFFTADDTEELLVRTKTAFDNATPSGNGVVAGVLARLWYLTGEDRHRARAEAVIGAFAGEINRNVFPLSTLINSAELLQAGSQVVILGEREKADGEALLAALRKRSQPNLVLQVLSDGESLPADHPAKGKTAVNGAATAYVCRGMSCSLPMTDPDELAAALRA